jgi:hypothetical protein
MKLEDQNETLGLRIVNACKKGSARDNLRRLSNID